MLPPSAVVVVVVNGTVTVPLVPGAMVTFAVVGAQGGLPAAKPSQRAVSR